MMLSSGRSAVMRRATASLLRGHESGNEERVKGGVGVGGAGNILAGMLSYLQPSVSVRRADHACQGLLASEPEKEHLIGNIGDKKIGGTCLQSRGVHERGRW